MIARQTGHLTRLANADNFLASKKKIKLFPRPENSWEQYLHAMKKQKKLKNIAHFRAPSNTLLPPVIKWQMESPTEDINMHLDQIVIQLCL